MNAPSSPPELEAAYLARLGERVRALRGEHRMTRRDLAQASGVSERYLAQLEAGRGNISVLLLERCLCVWLKASPEEHMSRVIAQGDMRPFRGRSAALDEIKKLLKDRDKLYARADFAIDTSTKTARQSLEEIRRALS